MSNENKKLSQKIKVYHILILGVILSPLIIINSNHVNNQRAEEKLYKEKSRLFNKIILGRKLTGEGDPASPAEGPEKSKEGEEEDDVKSKVDEVCERGSDELKKYYKTGNLEDIGLKEGKIKSEDSDKDYIKALIDILKSKMGGEGEEKENDDGGDGDGGHNNDDDDGDGNVGGRRNLSSEEDKDEEGGDDDLTNNIITYGKHLIPVLIFLVVALLCIPGWIMCCFCCCCNCYCCCCCKKKCCKIPCFVMTFALYALVVAVCFYGLSQSNHIFVGIADTECSILRFVDEVIDGESKDLTPKWAGFNGIKQLLIEVRDKLNSMGDTTVNELNAEIEEINGNDHGKIGKKKEFLDELENFGKKFYEKSNTDLPGSEYYHDDYTIAYPNGIVQSINGKFVLDIVGNFGKYNSHDEVGEPPETFSDYWVKEYKVVAETADSQMNTATESFDGILGEQLTPITDTLNEGINSMNDIDSTIGDIKGTITDLLADNSGTIDEYGKLGVKAVFGVLALIDIAIAAFMLLLCFCSGKCCTKCCCCRCICKLFTHLLWNILAILMIIVFLLGSLFALIGKVGEDAMSVISFLVSDDNLGDGKKTILLDSIKDYLGVCINGNGQLDKKLGFGDNNMDFLDKIYYAQGNITQAKNEFESKLQMVTYSNIIQQLEERRELKSPLFSLLPDDNSGNDRIPFVEVLNNINEDSNAKNRKEKWTIDCESGFDCEETHDTNVEICFQPKSCLPSNRVWVQGVSIKEYAQIITDMKNIIDKAFLENTAGHKYLNQSLGELGNKYYAFLHQYIVALTHFNNTIDNLTNDIKKYTGDNAGIFSFINCNFIGKNIKVMLKYLKEALGGDVYTIGVCLILVGCSLALSISFTILLIVVINIDIDNNKKKNNVPEYALNSGGRVIAYK